MRLIGVYRNTWYVRARSVEASLDVAHQWLDDYWANICPCLPNVCLWLLLRTRECCPSLQLMLASVLPCACIWLCFMSWYWRVLYLACIDAVLYTTYLYHALQNGKDHLPTMDGNQLVDIENHCHKISSLRNPKSTTPTILNDSNPPKNLNKFIKNHDKEKTIDYMYFMGWIRCILAELSALEVTTSKRTNCEDFCTEWNIFLCNVDNGSSWVIT